MRFIVAAAALCLLGCGDSAGPDDELPAELVGQWVAEPACAPPAGPCHFTLTWTANPQGRLDAVSAMGLTVRIQLTADGGFTRSGSGPAETGRVRAENNFMVVTSQVGVVDTIDYQVTPSALTVSFRREAREIDFNGDGQLDPARVTGAFRKQ